MDIGLLILRGAALFLALTFGCEKLGRGLVHPHKPSSLTWWSLSQPPTDQVDSDANPQEYKQGAESARQQAITRYEHLLESAPRSDQAAYARRVLLRLRLSIDTGQRRFHCSVTD